jgi:hypothetical protein
MNGAGVVARQHGSGVGSISQFVVWIHTAKRQTRKRRIRDSIQLLAAGKDSP